MTARERGYKLCRACGRTLALYMFHLNLRGNPQPNCKTCHTKVARENYRNRYQEHGVFSESERYRSRRRYESPDARERKMASARAYGRRMRRANKGILPKRDAA